MTNPRITAALAKLDRGSYSLVVDGFARRALKLPSPLSPADRRKAHDAMASSGLPHRRVPGPHGMMDVWDYVAP